MTRLKWRRKETEKVSSLYIYIKKLPDDFFKRQFTFFLSGQASGQILYIR